VVRGETAVEYRMRAASARLTSVCPSSVSLLMYSLSTSNRAHATIRCSGVEQGVLDGTTTVMSRMGVHLELARAQHVRHDNRAVLRVAEYDLIK
jgi:hypothetical protein